MSVPAWAAEQRHRMPTIRRIAAARDISFREPDRGFVYWPSVPGEWEATVAIALATQQRNEERGHETWTMPSPAEVDLLRALWFYNLDPELQLPIGPFDADFAFSAESLVVELDGRGHDNRKVNDAARDAYFAEKGWYTWRVPGTVVWADPLHAAREVMRRVADHAASVAA